MVDVGDDREIPDQARVHAAGRIPDYIVRPPQSA
jgi:hypothetical protein